MRGDIVQDQIGWFFRDNGDGTMDDLSGNAKVQKVTAEAAKGQPVVLVRNGKATGSGDVLASRVAVKLAERYAPVA
jgi:hypothetical protein